MSGRILPNSVAALALFGQATGTLHASSAARPDDSQPTVFQYQMVLGPADVPVDLVVRGKQAILVRRRAVPEMGGESIGVFRMEMSDERLDRLARAFPATVEHGVPIAPDAPNLRFRLERGDTKLDFRVPHRPDGLARVKQLVAEIEKLQEEVLAKPYRAIRLELVTPKSDPVANRPATLQLRLRNTGSRPVRLPVDRHAFWIEVGGAAKQEATGQSQQVVWEHVAIELEERVLQVDGGASVELSLPVTLSQRGESRVRAGFKRRAAFEIDDIDLAGRCVSKPITLNVRSNEPGSP